MIQQKKNDNVFSDLEDDISKSWGDIEKEIQLKKEEEEEKKEIESLKNNPTRFKSSNFKRFYETLVEVYKSGGQDISALHELLSNVFYNHHRKDLSMPKTFEEVWRIFCSPHEYDCSTGVPCGNCNKRFDIMFKMKNFNPLNYRDDEDDFRDFRNLEINVSRVHCPSCGYHILNITSGEVMGVFEHKEEEALINYIMEERRDGIRKEFRTNI